MYVSAEDEKIESYELRDWFMLMAIIQSLHRAILGSSEIQKQQRLTCSSLLHESLANVPQYLKTTEK